MNAYRVALDRCAVLSIRKLSSRLCEVAMSNNGKVLLVRVLLDEDLLRLLDRIQNVRLAILITVRANTKVNLAGVLVGLERLGDT